MNVKLITPAPATQTAIPKESVVKATAAKPSMANAKLKRAVAPANWKGERTASGRSARKRSSAAVDMAESFNEVFAAVFGNRRMLKLFGTSAGSKSLVFDRLRAAEAASTPLPAQTVSDWMVASRLALRKDALTALSLPASTLSRTKKTLDPAVTERMLRQSELMVKAAEVFGENGPAWMTKPHPMLDEATPSAYATNEYAAERVRSMLNAIEHGGVV